MSHSSQPVVVGPGAAGIIAALRHHCGYSIPSEILDRIEAADSGSSDLSAETTETLADMQAWMKFRLQDNIKYRAGEMPPTYTDGYSFVEIPEWEVRQKLEALSELIAKRK